MFSKALLFNLCLLISTLSHALLIELGANYSYQKKTFNETNFYHTDSKSATMSVYFLEKFALETNYTDSFYESTENDGTSSRIVQQSTSIIGADLMYVFTDKKSTFQPYIKGGSGFIKKKKVVKYVNVDPITIPTTDGWAPSYGAGLKIQLTERFGLKFGYDIWKTPLDDGSSSDDSSFKAGLTIYL